MWTEMPKLGWMSSSQTQTIPNFLDFKIHTSRSSRRVHVEKAQANVEPKVQRVLTKAQSLMCFLCFMSFYVYESMMCLCIFGVSSHQAPGIGSTIDLSCLVANVELIQLWCPMKRIVCALMKLHNLAPLQWLCCFFPQLFTRQHCVQGTCC